MVVSKKSRTATSTFGVGAREGHDSSIFYDSGFYENHGEPELAFNGTNVFPDDMANMTHWGDARDMKGIPSGSVHLMVTSPPYNCGKEYDTGMSLADYRELVSSVIQETHRVLVPGGRACINVAGMGRKPYIPLQRYVTEDAQDLGFHMRGEVIWQKGHAVANGSCAWGSWKSPTNPCLRDTHEYILIFCKGGFKRDRPNGAQPDISADRFKELTRSVWEFPPESAKRIGHPAPFPVELPRRCIDLYTFPGDVVLDPFAGSGTTGVAAIRAGRVFVGYDNIQEYVDLANKRIDSAIQECL